MTRALRGWSVVITLLALLGLGGTARAGAMLAHVTVDTSSLPGGTNGYIYLSLNTGGVGADSLTATVSNFSPAAGPGAVYLPLTNNVSGTLPGVVVMPNSTPPPGTELAQAFSYGASLSFDVLFTGPAVETPSNGLVGTTFALALLDNGLAGFPSLTSDPNGIVLTLDINPDGTVTPGTVSPVVGLQLVPVPEPSALVLVVALGGLASVVRGHRRRSVLSRN